MRRIALVVLCVGLIGASWACSLESPSPTGLGPQIQLSASNANPTAGQCTNIEGIVTLNGINAANGTGMTFTTSFGTFQGNGSQTISMATVSGTATAALCSTAAGSATVGATTTLGGSAVLSVTFH
jgi:hypothetical protein